MSTLHGTYPEPIEVSKDEAANRVTVRTRYYEVVHDTSRGGVISSVRYFHGTDRNILVQPMASSVLGAGESISHVSDLHETKPEVSCRTERDAVLVEVRGQLRDAEGEAGGIAYDFSYRYGWGYVRVTKRFVFADVGMSVRRLAAHQYAVRRELSAWGYRPAPEAEPSADPFAFGVFQWGRCRTGETFDTAFTTRFIPRHIVNADQGREGLEWFAASDLSQWAYQLTGHAGCGAASIAPSPETDGVSVDISPLSLPRGEAELRGEYVFEFYHGFPILSGRACQPFLHTSFNRHDWPSEDQIRSWAGAGIRTAHFHHDGDTFEDGLFWRDGTYPPFEAKDMAEYDRVIETCHRHGIRVATYFSNKELHSTTEAYQEHGEEWGRKPDDRGSLAHNRYKTDEYGAQMCLRSGWLDHLERYVDTVLSHHALDGVYYDWNAALYCQNPAHAPGKTAAAGPGVGRIALSPAGHWDMDELIDLMEWTRRRVGRDGLIIIHNTMAPCAAVENFADCVVAMEWGYGKLSRSAPALDDLPLEWDFMAARPRGVIAKNCIAANGDPAIERQMALRCLVTGSAPWPAGDVAREVFGPLRGYDLTGHRFFPWNRRAVRTDDPAVAGAVYVSPTSLILVVVNMSPRPQSPRVTLDANVVGLAELPKCIADGVSLHLGEYEARADEIRLGS